MSVQMEKNTATAVNEFVDNGLFAISTSVPVDTMKHNPNNIKYFIHPTTNVKMNVIGEPKQIACKQCCHCHNTYLFELENNHFMTFCQHSGGWICYKSKIMINAPSFGDLFSNE